jgi:hypothetical protein
VHAFYCLEAGIVKQSGARYGRRQVSSIPALEAYTATVADRLLGVLGADLVGVYLHGSAVLGGWRAEVSDVDLLGVAAGPIQAPARRGVAERLTDPALPCPAAHGLEFSLITAAAARAPTRSPPFELHVAHAPRGLRRGTEVVAARRGRGGAALGRRARQLRPPGADRLPGLVLSRVRRARLQGRRRSLGPRPGRRARAGRAGAGRPALGLLAKSPEAANGFTFFVRFLPYPSSAFVPIDTMPSWIHGFAGQQPATPVIETIRGLLLGTPVGTSPWLALAWCGGILLVSVALASALLPRRTR